MDNKFAIVQGIGQLYYKKIYGFYEEPMMFSCENQAGSKYLLLRLNKEVAEWLAVEVSDYVLTKLEHGKIEMRKPFVFAETGFEYIITESPSIYNINIISPDILTEDMLPFQGEYLQYKEERKFANLPKERTKQYYNKSFIDNVWNSVETGKQNGFKWGSSGNIIRDANKERSVHIRTEVGSFDGGYFPSSGREGAA